MDCKRAVELLWENDISPELEEHLKTCESCQRDRELIEKAKLSLSAPDTITEETMKKIKKEQKRRALAGIAKVAASLAVVAALAFFAKDYMDSQRFTENDAALAETETTLDKSESYNGVPEASQDTLSDEEPEAVEENNPIYDDVQSTPAVDYNDLYIRLFSFKDSLLLTSKSCDFIVDAPEEDVMEALEQYSPTLSDGYITLDSDFTFEVQEALGNAGIEILVTTSSESVLKTFIFFTSNI